MDQLSKYECLKKIGEGTYGVVYKAKDNVFNRTVVLKNNRIENHNDGVPSIAIREVSLLKELNHCNIVKLYNVFHQDNRLYLVFEHCSLDLNKFMKKKPDFFQKNKNLKKLYASNPHRS